VLVAVAAAEITTKAPEPTDTTDPAAVVGADKLIVVPVVPVIVVPAAIPAPRITAPTAAPAEDGQVIVEAPSP
jgi:hypothetical protein